MHGQKLDQQETHLLGADVRRRGRVGRCLDVCEQLILKVVLRDLHSVRYPIGKGSTTVQCASPVQNCRIPYSLYTQPVSARVLTARSAAGSSLGGKLYSLSQTAPSETSTSVLFHSQPLDSELLVSLPDLRLAPTARRSARVRGGRKQARRRRRRRAPHLRVHSVPRSGQENRAPDLAVLSR
jgi:hypothetical protein